MPNGSELIFVISTPRSGSTLLQRMLANAPEICTDVEAWLMLHPLYALREEGITTEYRHNVARSALLHFLETFGLGTDCYDRAVRAYADTFYQEALARVGGRYFLDKTPPYTRIIGDLRRIYPEAKFIYLLRNPMAILYSSLTTWIKGEWENLHWIRYDVFGAVRDLLEAVESQGNNGHVVRYESLVQNPAREMEAIGQYLGIEFPPNAASYELPKSRQEAPATRSAEFYSFQGDPGGLLQNTRPNQGHAEKWKGVVEDPQLLLFARSYVDILGTSTFGRLGYDYEEVRQTLGIDEEPHLPAGGGLIPWEVAIKQPAERTPGERLLLARAKSRRTSGGSHWIVPHLRTNWRPELRLLFDRVIRSNGASR